MLVVILTCLVLAGESLTLTPPTGFVVAQIIEKPAIPISPYACINRETGVITYPCLVKAKIIMKRQLALEDLQAEDFTVPKGCDVRVESEGKGP